MTDYNSPDYMRNLLESIGEDSPPMPTEAGLDAMMDKLAELDSLVESHFADQGELLDEFMMQIDSLRDGISEAWHNTSGGYDHDDYS